MNLSARFPPHLSTHMTFEKTSCVALGVHTPPPHANYPNADKGAWGPLVSQHGLANW
jgi:hypothetical protein